MSGKEGGKRQTPSETVSEREKRILQFWNNNAIFEKSEGRDKKGFINSAINFFKRKKRFVFYDGPPFATGLPHFGNILASVVKDAVPRYKTMCGFHMTRRWGWDCHGLPLEVEMEKKIGTKTKKEIEAYGVEKFNEGIRKTIFQYTNEWKNIIPRVGRWVDMENDYRTINTPYIESVWSVFQRLHKKGFVSNGFKSLHLCPRCSTVVSNAEVADSYETLNDIAVYVAFPLKDSPKTNLIAWTTTPWTLFGNVALGVNKDLEYVVMEKDGKEYVLHESAAHILKNAKQVGTKKGLDLVGKKYVPPFDFLYANESSEVSEKVWHVHEVPYIEEGVGTGIVHLAPAYGDEDMETAQKKGLPIRHHVTKDGYFTPQIEGYENMRPKEAGNPKEVDEKILQDLRNKEALAHSEVIEHSYPVCWRCKTPLLNYATNSWFVHAERFKDTMLSENKKVNWVPKHIRDGRFGNWLENAREWAISRDRFWGAPLPVWKTEKTGDHIIVSSLEEMFAKMRPNNQYTFVRHGHAQSNERGVLSCLEDESNTLTERGEEQVRQVAQAFENKKPTVIFCSPLTRTKQTADYISKVTGAKIVEEPLLIELQVPDMHGKPIQELRKAIQETGAFNDLKKKIQNGESFTDIHLRILQFFEKAEKEYKNADIVVVTHRAMIVSAKSTAPTFREFEKRYRRNLLKPVGNASTCAIEYKHVRRTADGEVDLHRPYIDDVVLYDKEGNPAYHTKEVFDCWFESGAMPYGSHHYPFENKRTFNPRTKSGFPADFISEGLDQTRGWFYSLMAIGVGAFSRAPYKRVIVTGLIRAADGKKMSKSLKNYTDPMEIIKKYGADALRHYLLSSPVVRGEDLDFKDEQIDEIYKKVYVRLHNCLNFYNIYAHLPHEEGTENLLDIYIQSRLAQVRDAMTKGFESYRMDEAAAPIAPFIEDLSAWYIRRSRERIKSDTKDGAQARETLRFVLTELSKCVAPIAPFYAEHLFMEMKKHHPHRTFLPESVHLTKWVKKMPCNEKSIKKIDIVRQIASLVHEQRSEAGIKVRQPLARVTVKQMLDSEQKDLISAEVNVKEVLVNEGAQQAVALNTQMTEELRAEGFVREYIRNIQKTRKEKGLSPSDTLSTLRIHVPIERKSYLQQFEEKIRKEVQAESIVYENTAPEGGKTTTIEGVTITSAIETQ